MNYDVNYFIKKFEAIPEDMFKAGGWGELGKNEPTCSTGHCGFDNHKHVTATPENVALIKLFKELVDDIEDTDERFSWKIVRINDGDCPYYPQPTPKQRILAALYDIKEMQEPKITELELKCIVIKERIKYVAVPETIKESVPENSMS